LLEEWLDRCHVLPGNHDDRVLMREVFAGDAQQAAQAGGSDSGICFSVAQGGWRLIGIDTHLPGQVAGRVEPAMLEWLAEELEQHASEPTILFQHHPPISVGSAWLDAIGLLDGEPYRELISSSPQVRAISCGHVHQEASGTLGTAVVLTVPSTSVQFTPISAIARVDSIPPGFRIFTLDDPADSVEVEAIGWSSRVVRLPAVSFPAVDE
jgi:Icc protein